MIKRILIAVCAPLVILALTGMALASPSAPVAQVPADFVLTEFADLASSDFGTYRDPTALAVGPDGRVYVALLSGRIYAFEDTDGDAQADAHQLFAEGLFFPAGMAWQGTSLYVTTPGEVQALADGNSDEDALDTGESAVFISDLPQSLQGLAFDSGGQVYIGVAADCDNCVPEDVRQGTIMRFDASGSNAVIYALGFHQPSDLAFYPGTDDLFALDDGRDDLGASAPPEEINRVQAGRHYGWPHCWDGGSDTGWGIFCTWTVPPLAPFAAHSSPAGMAFHDGTALPPEVADNAFVALRGNGQVRRVVLTPDGQGGYQAVSMSFGTDFEEPVDVAVGPDGTLYVADYAARKVYAIRLRPSLAGSSKMVSSSTPAPSDVLTYTLHVKVVGPGMAFTLTDPIPVSTTYVVDSAWASAGTIAEAGGLVTWSGELDANEVLSATFAVQLDAGALTGTVIVNTATLTGTEDEDSPYTLRAVSIVGAKQFWLPIAYHTH